MTSNEDFVSDLNPIAKVFTPINITFDSILNSESESCLNPSAKAYYPRKFSSTAPVLTPITNPYSTPTCSQLNPHAERFAFGNRRLSVLAVNTLAEPGCNSNSIINSLPNSNPSVDCSIQQDKRPLGVEIDENENPLDKTPSICDVETPVISLTNSSELELGSNQCEVSSLIESISYDRTHPNANSSADDINPLADLVVPMLTDMDTMDTSNQLCGNVSDMTNEDDPLWILKELKERNIERPVIGHLNINSLSSKFEPLTLMIKDNLDFLVITESKLDDTFPHGQFRIEGFARPIRLDRCRNGGGVIIFVREDLVCNY